MKDLWEFFRSEFDKLLVGFFVCVSLCFLIHIIHHQTDAANINQAWGVLTYFLGLLSGLITGRYVSKTDPNQPGPPKGP